jgi:hypothetical protein
MGDYNWGRMFIQMLQEWESESESERERERERERKCVGV